VEKSVLEEFGESALFYEEILNGGNLNWVFLVFCSGFRVGALRRGDKCVSPECLGEFNCRWIFGVLGGIGKGAMRRGPREVVFGGI
jgi:hypothetical protein